MNEALAMNIRIKPPPTRLLVSEDKLRAWLAAAKAGDVLVYHRGVLAIDRLRFGSRLPDEDRRELDRVASRILALANAGRGHLLQRRHGTDDYTYLFVLGRSQEERR